MIDEAAHSEPTPNSLDSMTEEQLRHWLSSMPRDELVDLLVSYIETYLSSGDGNQNALSGPLGELSSMSFGKLIEYLRTHLPHPELKRMNIHRDRVTYITDTGFEVSINATGESLQDFLSGGATSGGARTLPRPGPRPSASPNESNPLDSPMGRRSPAAGPMGIGGPSRGAANRTQSAADGNSPGRGGPRSPGSRPGGGPRNQPSQAKPQNQKDCSQTDGGENEEDDRFSMLEID